MKKLLAAALCAALLLLPALGAEATTQTVEVDGQSVEFSMYTVYDKNGFATNYVKLRDVAFVLRDTPAKFRVDYDGSTRVDTGADYIPTWTEMAALPGEATAENYRAVLTVDGEGCPMDAYLITAPGAEGGNFYFKLRDLGAAIGFTVGWSPERGVYIETQA